MNVIILHLKLVLKQFLLNTDKAKLLVEALGQLASTQMGVIATHHAVLNQMNIYAFLSAITTAL